ncbi:hypothetical protein T484DRAFT_1851119 [Baffinella frigidus]|nr:hypothetical protein T484DRAFT_1851119 [Cryptophyta sp. CCMP2293]
MDEPTSPQVSVADFQQKTEHSGKTLPSSPATKKQKTEHSGKTPPLVAEWRRDGSRANVNVTDNKQRTPLHLAAMAGHMEMVQTLLERGADTLPLTIDGKTAAELAIKYDHVPVAAMIQAESVRRDRDVAFVMGVHERLGYQSSVVPMDSEVMRMILG